MKKILTAGILAIVIGVGSLMAYADSPIVIPKDTNQNAQIENRDDFYKERQSFRKEKIKRALENKEITEAEAKEWEEHFDYMDEFHNKQRDNNRFMGNGYGRHMNGGFGCVGNGYGMGRGMMRGNRVRNY